MTALHLATLPPMADVVVGYRWLGPLLGRRNTRSRHDSGSIFPQPRTIPPAAMAARRNRLTWVAIFALPLLGLALGITVAALVAPEVNYLDVAFGAAQLLASAILSIGFAMPAFCFPQVRNSVARFHSPQTTRSCCASEYVNLFSESQALNKG